MFVFLILSTIILSSIFLFYIVLNKGSKLEYLVNFINTDFKLNYVKSEETPFIEFLKIIQKYLYPNKNNSGHFLDLLHQNKYYQIEREINNKISKHLDFNSYFLGAVFIKSAYSEFNKYQNIDINKTKENNLTINSKVKENIDSCGNVNSEGLILPFFTEIKNDFFEKISPEIIKKEYSLQFSINYDNK